MTDPEPGYEPLSVRVAAGSLYYCVSDNQAEILDRRDAAHLRRAVSRRDLMVLGALLAYATETVEEALSGAGGLSRVEGPDPDAQADRLLMPKREMNR